MPLGVLFCIYQQTLSGFFASVPLTLKKNNNKNMTLKSKNLKRGIPLGFGLVWKENLF